MTRRKRSPGFGHQRERQVKALLTEEGWWTIRAPASLGDADVLALRRGSKPRMIEVKANEGSPYKNFPPTDRRALIAAAYVAGAVAELAHWPPGGILTWYTADQWP